LAATGLADSELTKLTIGVLTAKNGRFGLYRVAEEFDLEQCL